MITRFGSNLEHQSLRGRWGEKGGGKQRGQNGGGKERGQRGREQKGEGEERKGGDEVIRMPSVEYPASHAGNCPSIFCL